MIFLTPEYASILSALVVIYYGIVVEHKRVTWSSVFFNTLSFIILLSSINLPINVFLALLLYTLIGYLIIKVKWKRAYALFGCKTYGSLMLVLILGSYKLFFGIYTIESVLISWIIVAVIVNIVGYFFK
ncbi:MAG: hypothetical protein ACP5NL_02760 [Thermoplasmata archaeon]